MGAASGEQAYLTPNGGDHEVTSVVTVIDKPNHHKLSQWMVAKTGVDGYGMTPAEVNRQDSLAPFGSVGTWGER